jgi:hypothetical protein
MGNLWQFWGSTALQVQVARLSMAASAAPTPAATPQARVPARDPRRGAKGDKAKHRPAKDGRGQRDPNEPRGVAGEENAQADLARALLLRDKIRNNLRDGMLDAVALTAQERAWHELDAADAAAIIVGSFADQSAVRAVIRDGGLEYGDGRIEMVAIREAANEELIALLGDLEYAELLKRIRGEN